MQALTEQGTQDSDQRRFLHDVAAETPAPPAREVHPGLYTWRDSLLELLHREATTLGGDRELYLARVECLEILDRKIAELEDRCGLCGQTELCDCEVSLA